MIIVSINKKVKGINKNVVATRSQNEYKDVLLNKKCLRHLMNRIQSKDHRIGTFEINKISLSCFDNKIYIQSNGCDGLALGCLNNYSEKLFCQACCFNFFSSQNSFFVKQFVLIFSLLRKAFLSNILNLKNAKHIKKVKGRINDSSVAS